MNLHIVFTCRVAKDKAAARKKNKLLAAQKVINALCLVQICVDWNSKQREGGKPRNLGLPTVCTHRAFQLIPFVPYAYVMWSEHNVLIFSSLQVAQKAQQTKVKAPKNVAKGGASRTGQKR